MEFKKKYRPSIEYSVKLGWDDKISLSTIALLTGETKSYIEKTINSRTDFTKVEARWVPKNIKLFGPEVDNTTAVRSIAAALQLSNQGIVGQTDSKVLDKNPCVFINPGQPLVQALVITEEDIRKQEERVLNARKKLEKAYKRDNLVN